MTSTTGDGTGVTLTVYADTTAGDCDDASKIADVTIKGTGTDPSSLTWQYNTGE